MPRILQFVNKALFVIATLAVITSIAYMLLVAFFGAVSKRIIYPIVFTSLTENLWAVGVIIFFVIGIAFFLLMLMAEITKTELNMRLGAKAVFLMVFANVFPFVVSVALLILPGGYRSPFGEWKIVSETHLNNRLYHLAYYTPDAVEGSYYYHLYECDSFNLFCQEIYNESGFTLSLDWGYLAPTDPKILIDSTANTIIVLQINDKTVYTYHVL